MAIELPTFELRGTPEEMGRQHGLALAPMIRRFVPMRFAAFDTYCKEWGRGGVAELRAIGRQCFELVRAWDPDGFAEHCAVAAAAGIEADDLFTAGNMTDMRDIVLLGGERRADADTGGLAADAEGCSAVLVPPGHSATGELICGQTWDLNPDDVDYVVGIHRLPDDGLETWSVTVAGCPSLVGMNGLGVTVGTTNVKTWGAKLGVGYMNILHRMLTARDAHSAAAIANNAPRSGAHIFWACDADEGVELETTPGSVDRRDLLAKPICRTNHCLSPAHQALENEAPSRSSEARLERLAAITGRGHVSIDTLKDLFADRRDGIDSVCRYAEDDQGTATDAVMVAIPARRELHACRGPSDRGAWQKLIFTTPY